MDHQCRLKNSDLRRAEDALLGVDRDIARCATFDHLHGLVLRTVRHIWKNAELYAYDTSLRIGAKLGLKPDKVFLHRGTRIPARTLGLTTNVPFLDVSALPSGLRGVEASELEDMLCLYKDEF
jgi:hypothetical protein